MQLFLSSQQKDLPVHYLQKTEFQVSASDSELDFDAQPVFFVVHRLAVLLREDRAGRQGGRDEGRRQGEDERQLSHEQGGNILTVADSGQPKPVFYRNTKPERRP